MGGPYVGDMAGPGGGYGYEMERCLEDFEWSVCWDFEMNSWGNKSSQSWQKPQQQHPSGLPSWMLPPGIQGMPPGPPPGPPPGVPPGGPWFGNAGGKKGNSWGGDSFEGPYVGDANSGDQEASWGGQKSWQSKKGGGQSWSGRGKGGKGWDSGPMADEESWQGSSWKQESWAPAGKGKGKGAGKGDEEWKGSKQDWDSGESWGKGSKKGGGEKGKDAKGGAFESKGEAKSKGKGKKGGDTSSQWQPSSAVASSAEAGHEQKSDPQKDDVVAEIDALLKEAGTPLEKADFDFRVRKFLFGLRSSGGRQKVKDALAMIKTYTLQKSRASVKNWPAYLLTLLKKLEPEPGAKGKGKGKGNEREQEKEEAKPAAKPAGKKAVAPVAASADAGAAPQGGDEADDVEVVRAIEETPVEPAEPPRSSFGVLPPGWEDGRSSLQKEICNALIGPGTSVADLRCPFTSEPLDIQASLISSVVASLRSTAKTGKCSEAAGHHLVGLARSRGVVDCPRAAAAAALVGGELASLPDDAAAMDAVKACAGGADDSSATTVLQEIALELTAEVLRTPGIGPGH